MADEVKSIVLNYPNISIKFACNDKSGTCFREFTEIQNGEYGYKLSVGDKLRCIRYRGSNKEMFVSPEIVDITDNGLLIKDIMGRRKNKPRWNLEHDAFTVVDYWDREPFFVPFRKWLPNGGEWRIREMYIEPCLDLFEKNKFSNVLSGDIANCTDNKDSITKRGTGIYYKDGGWRCPDRLSDANLKHFIKLGQQTII